MQVIKNFIVLNQPSSNIFYPTESILPDRFNSISLPAEFSIIGKELSSISEPDEDVMKRNVPIDSKESD